MLRKILKIYITQIHKQKHTYTLISIGVKGNDNHIASHM